MYLSEESWRKAGVRDNIDIHWYTSAGGMFPVPKYGAALKEVALGKNIDIHFEHLIQSVDGKNRQVTFKNTKTDELVTTDFDLLHIVPPQTAHQFVRESDLSSVNNCVDADPNTL